MTPAISVALSRLPRKDILEATPAISVVLSCQSQILFHIRVINPLGGVRILQTQTNISSSIHYFEMLAINSGKPRSDCRPVLSKAIKTDAFRRDPLSLTVANLTYLPHASTHGHYNQFFSHFREVIYKFYSKAQYNQFESPNI